MSDEGIRAPIVVTHDNGLRFAAQVRSHRVMTDQTERGGGRDSAPTPVELLGVSLGSCIAFYVHQFCVARGLDCEGMRVEVDQRTERNPARVADFGVRVMMPAELPGPYAAMLERVVRSCPAHNTLEHGAGMKVEIVMPVAA